jgi:succinate dehydrogenase / fumarate reductase cytochrome b subunit
MTVTIKRTTVDGANQSLDCESPHRKKKRPVSPHIQIYKWEFTMLYSILHRASAVGVGVIALVFMLFFAGLVQGLQDNPSGIVWHIYRFTFGIDSVAYIIIGLSALVVGYYIFATIKYMIWSSAKGLSIQSARIMGHISVLCSIIFAIGVLYLWVL